MKIILTNGTELNPIMITGDLRHVQGSNRDTLNFIFPATEDIAELDAVFTAENCESIMITDENGEVYVYKAYTIRSELSKKSVEINPATDEAEAIYEDRITVAMSQRTYAESQLASLIDTVDVLVMESLMA